MRSLHLVQSNAIETAENNAPLLKLEKTYHQLTAYLEQVKITKSTLSFVEHEAAVTRMIYTMGQAALSEVLHQYDVDAKTIVVEEKTYRLDYTAKKEYQTSLGPVSIERHMYRNRQANGDGKALCPMELQAGIIEGYWTSTAAKNAA